MANPVLFSNIHSKTGIKKKKKHMVAFGNNYIAMSIFFLFNNYVTKCVVFHVF